MGIPNVTETIKASNIPSIVVGDHNYGEGSSRGNSDGTKDTSA